MKQPRWTILVAAFGLTSAACGDDGTGTQGPPGGEGPVGPEGPAGPEGNPDEPSIGSVSPAWAWLSRSESVTISGYNTDWDAGTTVDFGAGITVDEVVVASPTSIVAQISVADVADLGAHDVVVTAGDGSLTSSGVFDVREGLTAEIVVGDGTQGSYNFVFLELHDPAHDLLEGEFTDPASMGFMHTIDGAAVEQPPLLAIGLPVLYDSSFAGVEVFIDPAAPADAPISIVTSDVLGGKLVSTGRLTVAPKTPVPLTLDTPETVTYGSQTRATHLLEYTNDSGEDQLVTLDVSAGSGGQEMLFRYAGNSGRLRDGFFNAAATLPVGVRDGESVFMMTTAPGGATGFTFDAEVSDARTAAFFASQEVDDDACEDAQDTGIDLGVGVDAMVIDEGVLDTTGFVGLSEIGESDWYRFSVSDAVGAISCIPLGDHDVVGIVVHHVSDCQVGVDPDLAPGDYYIRVAAVRLLSMRGAERYSIACSVAYL